MKRVVIVGGGFAGLRAARALAGSGLDVVLVDRQDHHLFTPLLYQVATAALPPEKVAIPIASIVRRWPGVSFRQAEVRSLDLQRRTLTTADDTLGYDYLVLTAGAVRNYFGLEPASELVFDLKSLRQALALRDHLLEIARRAAGEPDAKARAHLLTFAIVGAGPTGVEFAAALAELMTRVLPGVCPGWRGTRPRIVLIEAVAEVLVEFPAGLRRYALRRLRRLGVEVRLGAAVRAIAPGRIELGDDSSLECPTLVWAAGVRAAPVAQAVPVAKTRAGRLPVLPDLTIEGHPEVYVLGDMAYLKQAGAALPMIAPVAVQQGAYAGRAILRRERGGRVAPFHYRDMGAMAVLGHGAGAAAFRGLLFTGLAGWLVWFFLHLYYLAGFGNRLAVVLGWLRSLLSSHNVRRLLREQDALIARPGP